MNRDQNSAVNIMERFFSLKHQYAFLSPQPVGDGGLVVMGNHTKDNPKTVS